MSSEIFRDTIVSLLLYIHTQFGLSDPVKPPIIEVISTQQLEQLACTTSCADIKGWTTPNNIVYLSNELNFAIAFDKSILLHELVHHVQYQYNLNKKTSDCLTWKSREAQAYQLQIEWLQKNKAPYSSMKVNQAMRNFHRIKCPSL